jgi:hypothetical protein
MERLQRWQQVANAASTVAELVREKHTYRYGVRPASTLYLHTEYAEVRIHRWELASIEILAHIQAGFGWRIAHEQDDAGVYFVAKRRRLVGGLAGAAFSLTLPHDAHLILRLEHCRLWAPDICGQIDIPAVAVPVLHNLPARI